MRRELIFGNWETVFEHSLDARGLPPDVRKGYAFPAAVSSFIHPSSFILHPSSLILLAASPHTGGQNPSEIRQRKNLLLVIIQCATLATIVDLWQFNCHALDFVLRTHADRFVRVPVLR